MKGAKSYKLRWTIWLSNGVTGATLLGLFVLAAAKPSFGEWAYEAGRELTMYSYRSEHTADWIIYAFFAVAAGIAAGAVGLCIDFGRARARGEALFISDDPYNL